jgi:tryptophan-rich sensory protein
MNKYFIQLSLGDEWQRVFLREKRVGLGICLAIAYALSMVPLLVNSAMLNRKVTIFMIPSMIAIIVSGWMNMVIYYNRYKSRRIKTPQNTMVNGLFDSA